MKPMQQSVIKCNHLKKRVNSKWKGSDATAEIIRAIHFVARQIKRGRMSQEAFEQMENSYGATIASAVLAAFQRAFKYPTEVKL